MKLKHKENKMMTYGKVETKISGAVLAVSFQKFLNKNEEDEKAKESIHLQIPTIDEDTQKIDILKIKINDVDNKHIDKIREMFTGKNVEINNVKVYNMGLNNNGKIVINTYYACNVDDIVIQK